MGLFIFFSLFDWYQEGFKITEQKKDGFGYFWNNWTQKIFHYIAPKKDRCHLCATTIITMNLLDGETIQSTEDQVGGTLEE